MVIDYVTTTRDTITKRAKPANKGVVKSPATAYANCRCMLSTWPSAETAGKAKHTKHVAMRIGDTWSSQQLAVTVGVHSAVISSASSSNSLVTIQQQRQHLACRVLIGWSWLQRQTSPGVSCQSKDWSEGKVSQSGSWRSEDRSPIDSLSTSFLQLSVSWRIQSSGILCKLTIVLIALILILSTRRAII